jgi:hypothetical protein
MPPRATTKSLSSTHTKPDIHGQRTKPYLTSTRSFISDIGAFTLKPVFLVGGVLTATTYILTIHSVHAARYDARVYGLTSDVKWKKTLSVVAAVSGIVAGIGLTLLTILDTFRFHEEHAVLLLVCFVGLVLSMVSTAVVYWDQCFWPSPFGGLRVYCVVSILTVVLDFALGVGMYGFMQAGYYRVAGVLEWSMAYTGAVYLWAFIGFLSVPGDGVDAGERRGLLGEDANSQGE